jgi:protein-S-isoprenylcysteine O-methyltransferase Ste14
MLAVPTSTTAIGSWIALAPAAGFIAVIERRGRLEDEFLVRNLHGYKKYASLVPGGLPWTTKMRAEMNL